MTKKLITLVILFTTLIVSNKTRASLLIDESSTPLGFSSVDPSSEFTFVTDDITLNGYQFSKLSKGTYPLKSLTLLGNIRSHLDKITWFPYLSSLDVSRTNASRDWFNGNDIFPSVRTLTSLERLNLATRWVRDDGFHELLSLKKLKYLDVHSTYLTKAVIPHLNKMPQLETLNIAHTYIYSEDVPQMDGLISLTHLTVGRFVQEEHLILLEQKINIARERKLLSPVSITFSVVD